MLKKRISLINLLAALILIFFIWPGFIPPIKPTDMSGVVIKLRYAGGGKGTGPYYTLAVNGDGTVEFEGLQNTWALGKQTSTISQDNVRELVDEFYKAGYWRHWPYNLEPVSEMDWASFTSIRIGLRTKTVENYHRYPQRLDDLERKIVELSGALKWVNGTDPNLLPLPEPVDYENAIITMEQPAEESNTLPVYRLTIHGNGTVVYEGIERCYVDGIHEYTVSEEYVTQLINLFHLLKFMAITHEQIGYGNEGCPVILTLSIDGRSNSVVDSSYGSYPLNYIHESILMDVFYPGKWLFEPPVTDSESPS